MATLANPGLELPMGDPFIYGESSAIKAVNQIVGQILSTPIAVLLVGESGTGKEAYARLIHRLSAEAQLPIKKVSCTASDSGQVLSQVKAYLQPVEQSGKHGVRTLYLDGVDELDLGCQRMLVSVLPDDDGDTNEMRVRVISSSSRDLDPEVGLGRFRHDFYFRINGVCLRLPPLRERREDIPEFMTRFLAKYAAEQQHRPPQIGSEDMRILMSYDWPGNARELANLARKIIALGTPSVVIAELAKRPRTVTTADRGPESSSLKSASRAASRLAERQLIHQALERTHWNRKRAAQELQISYKSLLYKIKQTGLEGAKS